MPIDKRQISEFSRLEVKKEIIMRKKIETNWKKYPYFYLTLQKFPISKSYLTKKTSEIFQKSQKSSRVTKFVNIFQTFSHKTHPIYVKISKKRIIHFSNNFIEKSYNSHIVCKTIILVYEVYNYVKFLKIIKIS